MKGATLFFVLILLFVVIAALYMMSSGQVKIPGWNEPLPPEIPKIESGEEAVSSINEMGNILSNVSDSIGDIESMLE